MCLDLGSHCTIWNTDLNVTMQQTCIKQRASFMIITNLRNGFRTLFTAVLRNTNFPSVHQCAYENKCLANAKRPCDCSVPTPVVDFLFVIIEFFLSLTVDKRRSVEVGVSRRGWVTLMLNFRLNGYFSRHCDITQFTLTYSIISMFTSPIACFGRDHQVSHFTAPKDPFTS